MTFAENVQSRRVLCSATVERLALAIVIGFCAFLVWQAPAIVRAFWSVR